MALLTEARYRTITGDTATAASAVTAAAETAQAWLEGDLGRELEYGERTEVLRIQPDGTVYPTVTPVASVSGGLDLLDGVVYGATADVREFTGVIADSVTRPRTATITYTGGYQASAVPPPVEADLAWAVYGIVRPDDFATLPPGVTQVRLGDAAITYAGPAGRTRGNAAVQWSPSVWRWRKRRL